MAGRGRIVFGAVAALTAGTLSDPGARAGGARSGSVEHVSHYLSPMVVVPAGPFTMGAPDKDAEELREIAILCARDFGEELSPLICGDTERWDRFDVARPSRTVFVDSYSIDRFEVTVADYRECVAANACDADPLLLGDQRYHRSEWPIVNITHHEASAFCHWRGKRLPTEAEWEKAARGVDGRRWPWGNHWRPDGANYGQIEPEIVGRLHSRNLRGTGTRRAAIWVGSDADGFPYVARGVDVKWSESPYGAYNMGGNVAEWVLDYYSEDGYGDLPTINPIRTTPPRHESRRVIRGGSWLQPRLMALTYDRFQFGGSQGRQPDVGFRCAQDR